MKTTYLTARKNGWLPPLAAIIAMGGSLPELPATVQSLDPIGAAVLFAAAYVASCIGLVAMAIVGAFLIGLYFAKRPIAAASAVPVVAAIVPPVAPVVAAQPASAFPGLVVRTVTLSQPANGKAKAKVSP